MSYYPLLVVHPCLPFRAVAPVLVCAMHACLGLVCNFPAWDSETKSTCVYVSDVVLGVHVFLWLFIKAPVEISACEQTWLLVLVPFTKLTIVGHVSGPGTLSVRVLAITAFLCVLTRLPQKTSVFASTRDCHKP